MITPKHASSNVARCFLAFKCCVTQSVFIHYLGVRSYCSSLSSIRLPCHLLFSLASECCVQNMLDSITLFLTRHCPASWLQSAHRAARTSQQRDRHRQTQYSGSLGSTFDNKNNNTAIRSCGLSKRNALAAARPRAAATTGSANLSIARPWCTPERCPLDARVQGLGFLVERC